MSKDMESQVNAIIAEVGRMAKSAPRIDIDRINDIIEWVDENAEDIDSKTCYDTITLMAVLEAVACAW